MKRGDLFFCKPPGFVGKVRPAVIVQSDEFNDGATSATLCLLTSHIVDSKLRVTIDPIPENGLEKRSQVMIDKVIDVADRSPRRPHRTRHSRAARCDIRITSRMAGSVTAVTLSFSSRPAKQHRHA
ncbi:MAG: type II toxin-antitoxin system PemK/MazF family toxin [Burkholderiales bacterium]